MPLVHTRALILHAFAYGDTSRILRLLTPDLGVRSVIAKGARSPRSRYGAILEPFAEGEAQFVLREGRDLFTLSGFSLVRSRQGIGRHLGAFAGASVLSEIVLRFGTEEPQPGLYSTLVAVLDTLADAPADPIGIAFAGIWSVTSILGFQPEMNACVRCGRILEPTDPARLDAAAGGAACTRCSSAGHPLPPAFRAELAAITEGADLTPSAEYRHVHALTLSAFLDAHLTHGRRLRSLPLLLDQVR